MEGTTWKGEECQGMNACLNNLRMTESTYSSNPRGLLVREKMPDLACYCDCGYRAKGHVARSVLVLCVQE